jgi:hypothetical protein
MAACPSCFIPGAPTRARRAPPDRPNLLHPAPTIPCMHQRSAPSPQRDRSGARSRTGRWRAEAETKKQIAPTTPLRPQNIRTESLGLGIVGLIEIRCQRRGIPCQAGTEKADIVPQTMGDRWGPDRLRPWRLAAARHLSARDACARLPCGVMIRGSTDGWSRSSGRVRAPRPTRRDRSHRARRCGP